MIRQSGSSQHRSNYIICKGCGFWECLNLGLFTRCASGPSGHDLPWCGFAAMSIHVYSLSAFVAFAVKFGEVAVLNFLFPYCDIELKNFSCRSLWFPSMRWRQKTQNLLHFHFSTFQDYPKISPNCPQIIRSQRDSLKKGQIWRGKICTTICLHFASIPFAILSLDKVAVTAVARSVSRS